MNDLWNVSSVDNVIFCLFHYQSRNEIEGDERRAKRRELVIDLHGTHAHSIISNHTIDRLKRNMKNVTKYLMKLLSSFFFLWIDYQRQLCSCIAEANLLHFIFLFVLFVYFITKFRSCPPIDRSDFALKREKERESSRIEWTTFTCIAKRNGACERAVVAFTTTRLWHREEKKNLYDTHTLSSKNVHIHIMSNDQVRIQTNRSKNVHIVNEIRYTNTPTYTTVHAIGREKRRKKREKRRKKKTK